MQPATGQPAQTDTKTGTGVITTWFEDRSFGFLRRDDGRPNIYFHLHGVHAHPSELHQGLKVTYEIGTGTDGKEKAIHVRLLPSDD